MGDTDTSLRLVHGSARLNVASVRVEFRSGQVEEVATVGADLGFGVVFFAVAIPEGDEAVEVVALKAGDELVARQRLFPSPSDPENLEASREAVSP